MSESFPIVAGSKALRALKGDFDRLPTEEPREGSYYSPETVYRNFLAMSIAFSMNHACVVTCLAYASAELGDYIGSISSGVLYITFAVTAFLLSKPVVSAVGSKRALLIGVTGYCVYVAGFLVALIVDGALAWLAWTIMCLSAGVGGAAGGLLWTAQGRYFSLHARLYSDALGLPVERANSTFAGLFAMAFLGTETLTKLLATVVFLVSPGSAPYIVFSLYTLIALASCVVVSALNDLDDHGVADLSYTTVSSHAGSAARMVYNDRRMVLIIPFQLAFGFTSSFVPYYVFGTVVSDSSTLGTAYVGVLSAVIVLVGSAIAMPAAYAANRFGKMPVILVGGAALATSGLAFFAYTDAQLGTWALVLPLLAIYGVGRGTWENTNKASVADFFDNDPDQCTTAFAATTFFSGYASAMGFFSFASLSRDQMAGTIFFLSVVGVTCYFAAFKVHQRSLLADQFENQKVELRRRALEERVAYLMGR